MGVSNAVNRIVHIGMIVYFCVGVCMWISHGALGGSWISFTFPGPSVLWSGSVVVWV